MAQEDLFWKALAHSTRRQILDLLFLAPRSTGELVSALEQDRHVVMAHLAVLRAGELVLSQKQGRVRMNYLNAVPIQALTQRWISPVSGPWASALIAVRDRAEQGTQTDIDTSMDWKHSG